MFKGSEISIGDKVSFDGVTYWEVKRIVEEIVKTSKRDLHFYKLYFGSDTHRPMYSYKVVAIQKRGEEDV